MINNFKVYVINLKKETKRRENIINELKKQNLIDFEIIEAINGEKIEKSNLDQLISKNNKFINPTNTHMNVPEICCALSHINVYKKFLQTDKEYALIFEDDAVFLDEFSKKLQKFVLKNFKYKKQIILLSELWQFFKKPLDRPLSNLSSFFSCSLILFIFSLLKSSKALTASNELALTPTALIFTDIILSS